ncbi:tail fiber assembly protein [Enterobacter hormaechei]
MISSVFKMTKDLCPEQRELSEKFKVLFLNDEAGMDWYEYQKKFKDDTWKIAVDKTGRIDSYSKDCSSIFPLNLIVVEVNELPEYIDVKEPWFVNLETLFVYRDEKSLAEITKKNRIDDVSLAMLPLIQAEEDNDLTEDESEKLKAYRQYRTELRRLDISNAPNIQWPSIPPFVD